MGEAGQPTGETVRHFIARRERQLMFQIARLREDLEARERELGEVRRALAPETTA